MKPKRRRQMGRQEAFRYRAGYEQARGGSRR